MQFRYTPRTGKINNRLIRVLTLLASQRSPDEAALRRNPG